MKKKIRQFLGLKSINISLWNKVLTNRRKAPILLKKEKCLNPNIYIKIINKTIAHIVFMKSTFLPELEIEITMDKLSRMTRRFTTFQF